MYIKLKISLSKLTIPFYDLDRTLVQSLFCDKSFMYLNYKKEKIYNSFGDPPKYNKSITIDKASLTNVYFI